jgi:hypothetical protein
MLHTLVRWIARGAVVWVCLVLAACNFSPRGNQPAAQAEQITVEVTADGGMRTVQVAAGATVQQVLDKAGITLATADRVEPALYTVLDRSGASVQVVRVKEEFTVEEAIIPFERRMLQTESLPQQQELLAQRGENGLKEITYRIVYEDGVPVSRRAVNEQVVKEATPEILMVGIQAPFAPVNIPGRLVYLLGSNAWMMEQSTGVRKPVVTTGDLDGRIFSLSSDGTWLLFTRRSDKKDEINTLWAANLTADPVALLDLKVANVVHFADWVPGSTIRVAYSTVEPRPAAPGWQANNDLRYLTIYKSGAGSFSTVKFSHSIAGSYGWWGVSYAWAPDGLSLAYSNSDGVGWVGVTKEETPQPLLVFPPFQTRADWAWVPGVAWGPDRQVLYTVDHVAPPGSASPEESPQFDLTAIPISNTVPLHLASDVGMFAYPVTSPIQERKNGEKAYQVAYLQARFPKQSGTSPYSLVVMDRDGSNQRVLFPEAGEPGLDPQQVVWSSAPLEDTGSFAVALLYRGNLWLVDAASGLARQITGDGLTSRITWR